MSQINETDWIEVALTVGLVVAIFAAIFNGCSVQMHIVSKPSVESKP